MKLLKLPALLFILCCPSAALAQADPWADQAVLESQCINLNAEKTADKKAYVTRAIFVPGSTTGATPRSTLVRVLTATESFSAPKAMLFRVETERTRRPVATTVEDWKNIEPPSSAARCTSFALKVSDETELAGKPYRFEVVFLDFEKRAGVHESPETQAVGLAPTDVIVEQLNNKVCRGFQVLIKEVPAGFDWKGFIEWVERVNALAQTKDVVVLSYEPPGGVNDVRIPVRELNFITKEAAAQTLNNAQVCLSLASDLPVGKFPIKLSFEEELFQDTFFAPPKVDSRRHLFDISRLREGLKVTGDVPSRAVIGKDRDPTFNTNLEVGGSLTTSVEQQDDGTRKRKTEWVSDLRFEPFPVIDGELRPTQWNTNWRPLRVDATAASGSIARKTLSKNTIAFTSEVETWKFGSAAKDNIYRFQYGFKEASDRDFKKLDYVGYFRFKINPGRLERPKILGRKFGYLIELMPAGVEVGRADFRRRVSYVDITDTFLRRYYFGGNIKFFFYDKTTLTLEDTFHIRGESDTNRTKNYFKGVLESGFGLPSLASPISQTIFVQFERGNTPPFATPDANSFQFGLRFRWADWFK